MWVRQNVHPVWKPEAEGAAVGYFGRVRAKSDTSGSTISVTPRQFESVLRLSEACAKLRLSGEVEVADVEAATGLLNRALGEFGLGVDIDAKETGKTRPQWERVRCFQDVVVELCKRHGGLAPLSEIVDEAVNRGIEGKDAERLLRETKDRVWYEPKSGFAALVDGDSSDRQPAWPS